MPSFLPLAQPGDKMSSAPGVILVLGATGRQGGAVARALLADGFSVRAMTRRPSAAQELADAGAEIVAADLDDPVSLRAALRGVRGIYAMQTPYERGVDHEEMQGKRLGDLAREADVSQLVYCSVADADAGTGVAHFESKGRIEQHLRALRFPYLTILRPTFFMDMFLEASFIRCLSRNIIELAMRPDTRVQMIAVDDIARVSAHAFRAGVAGVIDLAGDVPSMSEMATAFATALARPIVYAQVAPATLPSDIRPKAGTQAWLENVGWHVEIDAPRRLGGVPLASLAQWLAQKRPIFNALLASRPIS